MKILDSFASGTVQKLSGNCGDLYEEGKQGEMGTKAGDGKEKVYSESKLCRASWLRAL